MSGLFAVAVISRNGAFGGSGPLQELCAAGLCLGVALLGVAAYLIRRADAPGPSSD